MPMTQAELRMRGSWRATRPRHVADATRPSRPRAPRELGREARAEWRRVVRWLEESGLLHEVDRPTLVLHCQLWERYVALQRELVGLPHASREREAVEREHRRVVDQLLRTIAALGLSPAARLRMPLGRREEDRDELAELRRVV